MAGHGKWANIRHRKVAQGDVQSHYPANFSEGVTAQLG